MKAVECPAAEGIGTAPLGASRFWAGRCSRVGLVASREELKKGESLVWDALNGSDAYPASSVNTSADSDGTGREAMMGVAMTARSCREFSGEGLRACKADCCVVH